jgi:hypothetical protein
VAHSKEVKAVIIRFSAAQLESIDEAAHAHGISREGWIRWALGIQAKFNGSLGVGSQNSRGPWVKAKRPSCWPSKRSKKARAK